MSEKMSFPEPSCYECPSHSIQGKAPFETRLCKGGKWKSKGKRFKSSDPARKVPSWCPRRLPTSVCRIYGYKDEMSGWLEMEWRQHCETEKINYFPSASHYKLCAEFPLGMKAKAFYELAQETLLEQLIPGHSIAIGEVLEIDDGLKPYYFVVMGFMDVRPVLYFNPAK